MEQNLSKRLCRKCGVNPTRAGRLKCDSCPPDYKRKSQGPCQKDGCTRKGVKLKHCLVHYRDLPDYFECSVKGCKEAPHSVKTPYCDLHYERVSRTGSTEVTQTIWQMACGKCLQCMVDLTDESWSKFFCTLRCSKRYYRGRSEEPTFCIVCESEISSDNVSTKIFCSERCSQIARTGNRTARERGEYNEITRESWLACLTFYGRRCINPDCTGGEGKFGNISRDHILPIALGGKHIIENIQPICLMCNVKKGVAHIDYRWDKGVLFMKYLKENDGRRAIAS